MVDLPEFLAKLLQRSSSLEKLGILDHSFWKTSRMTFDCGLPDGQWKPLDITAHSTPQDGTELIEFRESPHLIHCRALNSTPTVFPAWSDLNLTAPLVCSVSLS